MSNAAGAHPVILVLGATGQVGHALLNELEGLGKVVAAARTPVSSGMPTGNLADPSGLVQLVRSIKPQVIVNAAAYTAVDKAEADEPAALQVNGIGPALLADEAKRLGSLFIHYSTDYVFDGSGSHKRHEDEPTAPLNAYGRTKLAGELAIAAIGGASIVLRTSWVFSNHGQNFVKTMLRLAADRPLLKVVADQVGAPTSAAYIARNTAQIVRKALAQDDPARLAGLYHLACEGETTWYGFATAIFAEARRRGQSLAVDEVLPIGTAEYPLPAKRPLNSRLDMRKFHTTFGTQAATWEQELHAVMARLVP